jgi:Carboxypeptidase regulatory-like domain
MESPLYRLAASAACLVLLAVPAFAQEASIVGTVRDASGGVLPGVTVEAASPALIEKSRVALTSGSGQYRITNLVPGIYTVTFTLAGFTAHRHEGIEVNAEVTVQVNAELKVGALEETVTVVTDAPIVDVQNVAARTVMTREVMDVIPQGRNIQAIGIMIPGTSLQVGGGGALSRDVGGSGTLQQSPLAYRGSGASVQTVEGMRLNNLCGSGQYSGNYWNDGMFSEISYSTGADSAEMGQGGLRINMIPKDGGNTFRGTLFGNWTGDSWNGNNLTDDLKARGLTNISEVKKIYDFNPSFGGPIKRDRLWFQTTFRRQGLEKTVVDSYFDANPDPVRYTPDLSRPGVDDGYIMSGVVRLTWQATQKNKITSFFDRQDKKRGHWGISATNPPEASARQVTPLSYTGNAKWTSTLTDKLLFEAGFAQYYQEYDELYQPGVDETTYRITDQITTRACCAYTSQQYHYSTLRTYSGKLSFVTGAHNLTTGITVSEGPRRTFTQRTGNLTMRFGNTTSPAHPSGFGPNQVTLTLPTDQREGIYADTGIYVNDKWTIKRATLTAGLRFDWFIGEVLESTIHPSAWLAGATFPGFKDVPNWKDLSPRLGFAYDVFGNGKTAVKLSVSRYVDAETVGFASDANPISILDASENLTWTDDNGDFTIFNPDGSVQDRDFNPGTTANELAPIPASSTFGTLDSNTRIDDAIRAGWFKRGYQWEFAGGIQHEIMPRVSVAFNYYRRYTGGNQTVTDNLNVGPSDYAGPFCIPVPSDPRLPKGGGFQMCEVYEVTQAAIDRPADNFETFLKNFGLESIQYNHGYELNLSARLRIGTYIQGGVSADRSINDDCYSAQLGDPENAARNPATGEQYCHDVTPFRPDIKLLASHTFPWGIQAAATYQHVFGPGELAAWTYSQASANAAGFTLTTTTGSTAAQRTSATRTINLLQTGQQYGKGMDQLDLRVAKRVQMGRARLTVMADVYNAFNSDWVFSQNGTLGTNYAVSANWLRPTNVLTARMFKMGFQLEF